jgi:hypothetical protein
MRRREATSSAAGVETSVRFRITPRLVPARSVARWLGLSLEKFLADLPALRMEGFPSACSVTGNFDLHAIEAWQDKRSGLAGGRLEPDYDAIIRARIDSLG